MRKLYPAAVRGEGVYVWDENEKRYLDFSGSAAVNFIGHGVKSVAEAIAAQASRLEFVHSSQFTTQGADEFAQTLLQFAGDGYKGGGVFFTSGGSEAVETALKLARQYQVEIGQPNRFRIVSRDQAYHGATLGALAASGNRRRREIYLPMVRDPEAFLHIGIPYCYRCAYRCGGDPAKGCAGKYAKELELTLKESRSSVAAFIAEPISGATLGAVAPPDGYFQQVTELCRLNGALLISDEVMTGCGRTGRNLAMEHWNVEADIVVLAKGLSSGYLPLGAVIAKRKVLEAIEKGSGSFTHGFTYNAHPLCVAAGTAVFEYMKQKKLVSRAAESTRPDSAGTMLKNSLGKLLDCRSVGDVRGVGLLWGVEFVANKASKAPFPMELGFAGKVAEACLRDGVLVYPMQGCVDGNAGDHLLIAPPAVVSGNEIEEAVSVLKKSILEVESKLES